MFEKLKNKWQVSGIRLVLILCTFALGGSLCAFLGGKIMPHIPVENRLLSSIIYILLVTLLWPFCVLLVSLPFGQWKFFLNYLARMGQRMRGRSRSQSPDRP